MTNKQRSFGEVLRKARIAKGCSLRKFAGKVGISPTYLSLVEQGKVESQPTAERVKRMAELLDENVDKWIALAGRVPEDVPGIIHSQPTEMPQLLREASGLTAEQLRKVTNQIRRMKQELKDEDK